MRVSRGEFAAACGVSRQAVAKAIAAGWLVLEADGRTPDSEHPWNARYLSDHVAGLDVLWRQTYRRPGAGVAEIVSGTAETLKTARARGRLVAGTASHQQGAGFSRVCGLTRGSPPGCCLEKGRPRPPTYPAFWGLSRAHPDVMSLAPIKSIVARARP